MPEVQFPKGFVSPSNHTVNGSERRPPARRLSRNSATNAGPETGAPLVGQSRWGKSQDAPALERPRGLLLFSCVELIPSGAVVIRRLWAMPRGGPGSGDVPGVGSES